MFGDWYRSSIDGCRRLRPTMSTKLDRLVARVGDTFDKDIVSRIYTDMQLPAVLVHGDLHMNNILWNRKDGKLGAIVDWQVCIDWVVFE